MRSPWALSLAAVGLGSATLAFFACSDDPDRPRKNAGQATAVNPDFTFKPASCAYEVKPPATRAYLDQHEDDTTPAPTGKGDMIPARVRIGLGGNGSAGTAGYADPSKSAVFTWETSAPGRAAKVKLGISPTTLDQTFSGYSFRAPVPEIGLGADVSSPNMHEVHACGLVPGTTYYYQVGGGPSGSEVWSATQSFTTVPDKGAVVVGITGDARDRVTTWQLVQSRMKEAAVPLQLFSGDLVLSGSDAAEFAHWLDAAWKDPKDPAKFLSLGEHMFVPIAGNHENEAVRFYAQFSIPGDGPYAETAASFNVRSAHVVMVDDQANADAEDGDQAKATLAWLEKDLQAADADRAAHPFIVVVSHRAIFSTSKHARDSDVLAARKQFVPLFDKYRVNLVFNGHDHEFERSKPIRGGASAAEDPTVQPSAKEGTTYVIVAGSGANPYEVGTTPSTYRDKAVAFGNGTPYIGAYGLLTIEDEKLTLRSYGLKEGGGNIAGDELLDTFELAK